MEPKVCPLCNQEPEELRLHNGICEACSDLLEFGYPSFPAYILEEG